MGACGRAGTSFLAHDVADRERGHGPISPLTTSSPNRPKTRMGSVFSVVGQKVILLQTKLSLMHGRPDLSVMTRCCQNSMTKDNRRSLIVIGKIKMLSEEGWVVVTDDGKDVPEII
jgi:hypothetical protein